MADKTIQFKFYHYYDVPLTFDSEKYICRGLTLAKTIFRTMMWTGYWRMLRGFKCEEDDVIDFQIIWGNEMRWGRFEDRDFEAFHTSNFLMAANQMLEDMWYTGI